MGEGRAHSLAGIHSVHNSCYLLKASPRSNKHLLGASRVPGTVPGEAEYISARPRPPSAPLWESDQDGARAWPGWSHFTEEETEAGEGASERSVRGGGPVGFGYPWSNAH